MVILVIMPTIVVIPKMYVKVIQVVQLHMYYQMELYVNKIV